MYPGHRHNSSQAEEPLQQQQQQTQSQQSQGYPSIEFPDWRDPSMFYSGHANPYMGQAPMGPPGFAVAGGYMQDLGWIEPFTVTAYHMFNNNVTLG